MLRRLLTGTTEEEKRTIKNITSCIKFMHQNYDIEFYRLARLQQAIHRELKVRSEPTVVSEEVFAKHAGLILRIQQFPETRLFERLRSCLLEDGEQDKLQPQQI